jgi:hypothetical protein
MFLLDRDRGPDAMVPVRQLSCFWTFMQLHDMLYSPLLLHFRLSRPSFPSSIFFHRLAIMPFF